jgi:ketol-acid reductoisomerase
MDWMFNNCSETARIGAFRWKNRFRDNTKPLFDSIYELVVAGEETRIVLERSRASDYKRELEKELMAMGNSELWKTGATVRSLRPQKTK